MYFVLQAAAAAAAANSGNRGYVFRLNLYFSSKYLLYVSWKKDLFSHMPSLQSALHVSYFLTHCVSMCAMQGRSCCCRRYRPRLSAGRNAELTSYDLYPVITLLFGLPAVCIVAKPVISLRSLLHSCFILRVFLQGFYFLIFRLCPLRLLLERVILYLWLVAVPICLVY